MYEPIDLPMTWGEQWLRVQRWQRRYEAYIRPNAPWTRKPDSTPYEVASAFLEEGELARDMAYAVIQSIHHLRDWVINDSAAQVTRDEVESFVNSSKVLCIVADICNGSKHAVLKRPRYDGRVDVLSFSVGDPVSGSITKYVITPEGPMDVKDFVQRAIDEWSRFIEANDL
jgi:hypothetical protein